MITDTIRSFIAVELPPHILEHLSKIQNGLRECGLKVRWVKPENIHLTLKFLGDIRQTHLDPIASAMKEAAENVIPISLIAKGIGVFPGIKHPKVIWTGLHGEVNRLMDLQKDLEDYLEVVGFPKEERPFKAHLTIARVKESLDPQKLSESFKAFLDTESEPFAADSIVLFRSELKPSGPVYSKLRSVKLICPEQD